MEGYCDNFNKTRKSCKAFGVLEADKWSVVFDVENNDRGYWESEIKYEFKNVSDVIEVKIQELINDNGEQIQT